MKVAVIGSTGPTGLALVSHALSAGHEVYALARNPGKLRIEDWVPQANRGNLHVVRGDVYQPETLVEVIRDADIVYSLLGVRINKPTTLCQDGTVAIIDAMKKCGKTRLILTTSCGDDPDVIKASAWFFRRFMRPFILNHVYADFHACEKVVQAAGEWLDYTIVQPGFMLPAPATHQCELVVGGIPVEPLPFADCALAMLQIGQEGLFSKSAVRPVPRGKVANVDGAAAGRKYGGMIVRSLGYKVTRPAFVLCVGAAVAIIVAAAKRK